MTILQTTAPGRAKGAALREDAFAVNLSLITVRTRALAPFFSFNPTLTHLSLPFRTQL